MVEHTTVRISESFKDKINEFDGSNFEERLKKWAGVSEVEYLTREEVKEVVINTIEERESRY